MARNTDNQKTSKSAQTKRHIVSSFLRLMDKKPWEKITVIEICRQADITRGTFYQYFGDIYDLVEQLEESLLTDLQSRLDSIPAHVGTRYRTEDFLTKYDATAPRSFLVWFEFCRDHRDAVIALLDRKNGDAYFIKKLKNILKISIEKVMEADATANDDLRSHFVSVFMDLHILGAQSWLESDSSENDYLSVEDIVNILNTMRVGAQFLAWRDLQKEKNRSV